MEYTNNKWIQPCKVIGIYDKYVRDAFYEVYILLRIKIYSSEISKSYEVYQLMAIMYRNWIEYVKLFVFDLIIH